jgi:6-phosphogluconate dehydrogenase
MSNPAPQTLGIIGLGRMGAGIARRLMRAGHHCVVFDTNAEAVAAVAKDGAKTARTIEDMPSALGASPRAIWVMLPSGHITEQTVALLGKILARDDIIIDGGNTYYKDDIRRAAALRQSGIHYVDVGTSGGVWGLERGYCMMIGGDKAAVDHLDPIFDTLAPGVGSIPLTTGRDGKDSRAERGYIHAGPNGAGHFVKMVHNGIEYGLMQAYGEGFDILRNKNAATLQADERFELDLADIAEVWLLDLSAAALAADETLEGYSGYVDDSGEGRWTIEAAIEEAVPADVLSSALYTRFRSRRAHTFAEKMLSAMRFGFGGHTEGMLEGGVPKKSEHGVPTEPPGAPVQRAAE